VSAQRMVELGSAAVHNENGKVKSVRLLESASSHALRIGEPQARLPFNTKFTRRVKTESGHSWVEHHPRATYEEPDL
jgi:hypothetical protein